MAKPNFKHQKKQREAARKERQNEKLARRGERVEAPAGAAPVPDAPAADAPAVGAPVTPDAKPTG
jgi:hypothetical protein